MKSQTLVKVLGVVLLAVVAPLAVAVATAQHAGGRTQRTQNAAAAGDYKISGPYTHNNLAVFLIHGKDKLAGKTFLTLQEALKQRKVIEGLVTLGAEDVRKRA